MKLEELKTLEDVQAFLDGTQAVTFEVVDSKVVRYRSVLTGTFVDFFFGIYKHGSVRGDYPLQRCRFSGSSRDLLLLLCPGTD